MRRLFIGTLLALSLLAAPGLASGDGFAALTGDGGSEAEGQAEGEYYVDASGATDAAYEQHDDAQAQANEKVRSSNEAVTEAQWDAYDRLEETERPECECDPIDDETLHEVEQVGNIQAKHADRAEKAAHADTEYVDAGADVGLAAQAQAWMSDTLTGIAEVYHDVQDKLDHDAQPEDDAKDEVKQSLETENELRNEVTSQAQLDNEPPELDPSVSGDASAEHATEVATEAAGNGDAEMP